MPLVTQATYARHRGVSREAVRQRTVKAGGPIPVHGPQKLIDPAEADALWDSFAEDRGRGGRPPTRSVADARAFQRAKTDRMIAEARRAELELAVRRGALVERAVGERIVFAFGRRHRDAWLGWPARIGAELAAALGVDAGVLIAHLEAYVARQLHELSEERFDLGAAVVLARPHPRHNASTLKGGSLYRASLPLVLTAATGVHGACNAICKRDVARCVATQCARVPRAACRRSCKPAAIRTLAYALSECSRDAAGMDVWRQALRIRRGDREPITVVEFGSSVSTRDNTAACIDNNGCATGEVCAANHRCTGDLCHLFTLPEPWGGASVFTFPLQRLGVSPDAANVVFEVNDEVSVVGPPPTLSPEQKGFFLVRSDGGGLRRLGPASRDPSFRFGFSIAPPIVFSPNGRRIAFTDLGPGPGGEEAVQIAVLDLATGERAQVTHLPTGTPPRQSAGDQSFPYFLTCCPTFLDNETLLFQTFVDPDGSNPKHNFAAFTVRIDGSGLTPLPQPVAVPGSEVVPTFGVTGRRTNLLRLSLPGTAEGPPFPLGTSSRFPISEVFFQDGKNLLQLTNFHLQDTFIGFLDPTRMRAFFLASADPLGTNPFHICQMFSIDTFGSGLRQVTHLKVPPPFDSVDFSSINPGCFTYGDWAAAPGTPPTPATSPLLGCGLTQTYYRVIFRDPVTEAVVFDSSCDPLGTHSVGEQIFAMRPDGQGLRQLTDAAGVTTNPDGTFSAELPGPYAYSALRR